MKRSDTYYQIVIIILILSQSFVKIIIDKCQIYFLHFWCIICTSSHFTLLVYYLLQSSRSLEVGVTNKSHFKMSSTKHK